MKEEDIIPGTIYPLLENMLFFLPKRLKKKLCCVNSLGQTVNKITFNQRLRLYVTLTRMKQMISYAGRMGHD